MSEHEGLTLTAGDEGYAVQYLGPDWLGNIRGYYYLLHTTNKGSAFTAIARFTDEDEARAFMAFLEHVIPSGREV